MRAVIFVGCVMLFSCNNPLNNNQNLNPFPPETQTYEQKVMSVEEVERADPLRFLDAKVNYKFNFWGDKVKLDGKIINTATVANYKDVTIKISFFTKTRTFISSKKITIYEYVNAGKSVTFFEKLSAPSDCFSITADVVSATPY